MKSYRELEVWQVSMSLAKDVYCLVRKFPPDERFALSDQMRRCVVSIPSNIAEGFGRETTRDFIHFLSMARGSLYELETQLQLAAEIGFCGHDKELGDKIERVAMMVNALSSKLKMRLEARAANHEPRTTK